MNNDDLSVIAKRFNEMIDREVFYGASTESNQEVPTLTLEILEQTILAMKPRLYYLCDENIPETVLDDDGVTRRPVFYAYKDPDYDLPTLIIHPDMLPEVKKGLGGRFNLIDLKTDREEQKRRTAASMARMFPRKPAMYWPSSHAARGK